MKSVRVGSQPWSVLRALPSTAPDLARRFNVEPKDMWRTLSRLRDRGLIKAVGARQGAKGIVAVFDRTEEAKDGMA